MRGEEGALQTNAAVAVAEEDHGVGAVGHGGVATGFVFVHGRNVGGEKSTNGVGHEVAHVVGLVARGSLDRRVPDFDLVAGFQFECGDTDGIRAGLDVGVRQFGWVGSQRRVGCGRSGVGSLGGGGTLSGRHRGLGRIVATARSEEKADGGDDGEMTEMA